MELILRMLRPLTRIFAVLIAVFVFWTQQAQAADPIKIGFSASLTGALASSGKANLLAQQIWAEEINAKGGLYRVPLNGPDAFFAFRSWAGCTINMSGFDLRQAQYFLDCLQRYGHRHEHRSLGRPRSAAMVHRARAL